MKVTTRKAAWEKVNELFPTDYIKNDAQSIRAGYDIYTSTAEGYNGWISDLDCRLEINLADGRSINIWIEEAPCTEQDIDGTLAVVDEALYQIEDNCSHCGRAVGIEEAHTALYSCFKQAKEICDKYYPESYLYKKYNLCEA